MHKHIVAWVVAPPAKWQRRSGNLYLHVAGHLPFWGNVMEHQRASERFIMNVRKLQETCFVPINFAQGTVVVGAGLPVLSLQDQCFESSKKSGESYQAWQTRINKFHYALNDSDPRQEQTPVICDAARDREKPITESPSSVKHSKRRFVSLACRRHSLLRGCVLDYLVSSQGTSCQYSIER